MAGVAERFLSFVQLGEVLELCLTMKGRVGYAIVLPHLASPVSFGSVP